MDCQEGQKDQGTLKQLGRAGVSLALLPLTGLPGLHSGSDLAPWQFIKICFPFIAMASTCQFFSLGSFFKASSRLRSLARQKAAHDQSLQEPMACGAMESLTMWPKWVAARAAATRPAMGKHTPRRLKP